MSNYPRWRDSKTPFGIAFAKPWPTKRRGFRLWIIALGLGLRGVLYAIAPETRSSAFQFPVDWLTTQVWGIGVVVVCLAAAYTSYCHFGRDAGDAALTVLAAIWGLSYLFGWLFRDAGDAALQGLLSFALITALLVHSAGDPEYLDTRPQAAR